MNQALTLLLRLEPVAAHEKITSRRRNAQSTLVSQRSLIKKLTDRLHQLERDDSGVWSDEEPDPDEDILAIIRGRSAPIYSDDTNTMETRQLFKEGTNDRTSSIRNRHQPPSVDDGATTTGASVGYPPPTRDGKTAPQSPADLTARALEHDSDLQSDLTQSLLSLATTLKDSSRAFSDAIGADTLALRNATDSLDKNTGSMETASKNMGLLKRMSEGKGWWGRMMLYAWIGGLWVVAILLVFVGPKIRF